MVLLTPRMMHVLPVSLLQLDPVACTKLVFAMPQMHTLELLAYQSPLTQTIGIGPVVMGLVTDTSFVSQSLEHIWITLATRLSLISPNALSEAYAFLQCH